MYYVASFISILSLLCVVFSLVSYSHAYRIPAPTEHCPLIYCCQLLLLFVFRPFFPCVMMKDPFEAALEDQETPPDSPVAAEEETPAADGDEEEPNLSSQPNSSLAPTPASTSGAGAGARAKEDEEEYEEEENVDVDLRRIPSGDPDKLAKMQSILKQFTEAQMSRYESFRRSGFQKSNMRRLLASIAGTQKISTHMPIVVSGIAKMFVGELVETARIIMTERKESGPIRPCHIREAYRRLKLEGKVLKRSVPRLFH